MKLFIAIGAQHLSFDPKLEFKKLKVNLSKKEIDFRWVPSSNYHITVVFLGETPESQLESIKHELTELSQQFHGMNLKVHEMDAFPNSKEGRVVYVGIQNSKELRALQEDCKNRMEKLTFKIDPRPFIPHLTIARLRNPRNLMDIISPLKNHQFGVMEVKELTLFESKISGPFPVYQPLASFPLLIPL